MKDPLSFGRGDDHFQGFVPHNGISAAMDPVGGR